MKTIGFALAAAILVGTACSGGSGTTSSAQCRPTPGQPAQSSAATANQGSWSIKLGPGMEVPVNADTIAIASRGQELTVSGIVYGQDCVTRLAGATIHVWQVDSEGDYGPIKSDGGMVCCYLQGTLQTGVKGQYEVRTIVPPHYRDTYGAAHIHFEVLHPRATGIMTELQFAGDPDLDTRSNPAVVVPLVQDGSAARATFDIVLRDR
jgi:protocatechuate 3,4-dioxygenase beta subunit